MKFHPSQPDSLATGSTDGLVCVFDISQTPEDDAILWTFNTESSVVSSYFVWTILGFFLPILQPQPYKSWDLVWKRVKGIMLEKCKYGLHF